MLFYTIAWPLTVASNISFFVFFYEDQKCQTYIDFGFEPWRSQVVLVSVIAPLVALTSDFLCNRLVMSYKHLIVNILFTALYLFLSFLGSIAQNRPIYGNHLGYLPHDNFKYQYVTVENDWQKEKLQECKDHFGWTSESDIPVDWKQNGITLATILASVIITHILITALSNLKAKKYFQRDGNINDKKAQLLDNKST